MECGPVFQIEAAMVEGVLARESRNGLGAATGEERLQTGIERTLQNEAAGVTVRAVQQEVGDVSTSLCSSIGLQGRQPLLCRSHARLELRIRVLPQLDHTRVMLRRGPHIAALLVVLRETFVHVR